MSHVFDIAACIAQKMLAPKQKMTIRISDTGGLSSIQKNININGQPHKLSYINRDEASLLRQLGGSGRNVDGIPAYYMGTGPEGSEDGPDEAVDEGEPTGPGQGELSREEQDAITGRGMKDREFYGVGRGPISLRGLKSATRGGRNPVTLGPDDEGLLTGTDPSNPVEQGYPAEPDPMHISQRRRPLRKAYGDLGPLESILSMYGPESYNPILGQIDLYDKKLKQKDITKKAIEDATNILSTYIGEEKDKSIDLLRLADEVEKTDPQLADDLRGRVQDNINREIFSKLGPDPGFAKELSTFGLATYGKGLWKKGERRTPFAMTKTEEETYKDPKEVGSILGESITRFEQIAKANPNLSLNTVLAKYNKDRDTYHTVPLNMADLAGYGYKGAFAAGPQVAFSNRQKSEEALSMGGTFFSGPLSIIPRFSKEITGETPGGTLLNVLGKAGSEVVSKVADIFGQGEEAENLKEKGLKALDKAKKYKSKVEKIYSQVTDPVGAVKGLVREKATDFLLDNLVGKDQYTPERIIYEEEQEDLIKNKWKPIEGRAYPGQGTSQTPYLSPDYVKAREDYMKQYDVSDMDQQGLSGRGKFYHRGKQLSKEEQDELLNQHRQSTGWPRWRRATGGLVTLLSDDRDPSDTVILQDSPIDT